MAFHNKGYFKRIRRGFTLKSRKIGQFQPFFLHFLDFDWPKNQIFKNRRPGYRLPIFSPILILCLGYRSRFYVCFRLARSISISYLRHTCTHFHYGVTPSSFQRLTPDKPRDKSARIGVVIGVVMEKQELRGVHYIRHCDTPCYLKRKSLNYLKNFYKKIQLLQLYKLFKRVGLGGQMKTSD